SNLSCRAKRLRLVSRRMWLWNLFVLTMLTWLGFIPLLAAHEFAHAWTAWKCGDDTAYKKGRVTLNPAAHMEWIGTVILPILTKFFSPFMISRSEEHTSE